MNLIRRFAWVVALAGIAAGCGEEEGQAPAPQGNPTTASPSLAPKKPIIPPSSAEDKEKAPKGEPGKAEAPADKEHSAKGTEPAPPTAKPAEGKKGDETPKLEPPKGGTASAAKLGPEELANIKELPPADQELAIKQVFCPVQGDKLGEMGKPFKVTVAGRTVFLCCEGCEEKIKADPKKYFAKLDAKNSAAK